MKVLSLACVLALVAWSLSACASQEARPTESYVCPDCRETVRWSYRSDKFGLHNKKVVTHTCPSCEKGWTAGVSEGNACAMCMERSLECPICAKHHPGASS